MGLAAFNRMRRLAINGFTDSVSEIDELRARAKELGITQASRKGEERLREEIAEAEATLAEAAEKEAIKFAEVELQTLRDQAIELGIEEVGGKDAETLRAEIAGIAEKGGGDNARS